jgi:hypothetical protein
MIEEIASATTRARLMTKLERRIDELEQRLFQLLQQQEKETSQ